MRKYTLVQRAQSQPAWINDPWVARNDLARVNRARQFTERDNSPALNGLRHGIIENCQLPFRLNERFDSTKRDSASIIPENFGPVLDIFVNMQQN